MTRWAVLLALSVLACSSADSDETHADSGSEASTCRSDAALGACTSGDVEGYWTACLDPAAFPIDCQQFTQAHADCSNCLAALYKSCSGSVEHDAFVEAANGACRQ